jgi:hypothetical protein
VTLGVLDFVHTDGGDLATAAAVDAPHGVEQEDEESPQGNELKAPLRELVVASRGLMAARADSGRALARSHGDLDTPMVRTEDGTMINKSAEAMTAI